MTVKQLISEEHADCKCDKEKRICTKLSEQFEHQLKSLKKANRDLQGELQVSQTLSNILFKLECIWKQFEECISLGKSTPLDKQDFIETIDDILYFYKQLGCYGTSLFYERNSVYQGLNSRSYKICCVCGLKTLPPEKPDELKDAVAFKGLLIVEDEELEEWMALMRNDDDELGAQAQECFHRYSKSGM